MEAVAPIERLELLSLSVKIKILHLTYEYILHKHRPNYGRTRTMR